VEDGKEEKFGIAEVLEDEEQYDSYRG